MKKLIYQSEQYLRETLGIPAVSHPWQKSSGLPLYLRDRYSFFRTDVLGTECVLMADTEEHEQTPAVIGKHVDQVRSRHHIEVVYVRHAVTSYNRRRLIEQKIPFIVPGNQMYLPMLGLDLREHLKRQRATKSKSVFSPSTQMLILEILYRDKTDVVTPTQIAQQLGYSAMTMTRAFDELETAGIGEHSVLGKERHLRFAQRGRMLWEKVLPYLNTPVKRRLYVAFSVRLRKGILAGQSALARYTMMAEPQVPVYAFSVGEWKAQKGKEKILELALPEAGGLGIELWKYPPAHFAQQGTADRLSLYLSLKDSVDERVQSALDELLEGVEW